MTRVEIKQNHHRMDIKSRYMTKINFHRIQIQNNNEEKKKKRRKKILK